MFALADRLGMTVEEFVYWLAYLEEMNRRMERNG